MLNSNKTQIKVEPDGLPEIWIDSYDYCDRCNFFKECLGFIDLSDTEWKTLNDLISFTNDTSALILEFRKKNTKYCAVFK